MVIFFFIGFYQNFVKKLGNFGEVNEIKYVINANWWKNWIDYVKFDEKKENSFDSFESSPIKEEKNWKKPGKIINRSFFSSQKK